MNFIEWFYEMDPEGLVFTAVLKKWFECSSMMMFFMLLFKFMIYLIWHERMHDIVLLHAEYDLMMSHEMLWMHELHDLYMHK